MLESILVRNGAPAYPDAACLPVHLQRALAVEEARCVDDIVRRVIDQRIRVLAVEGDPGTGKTTLRDRLALALGREGVLFGAVSTDDDVLPRKDRPGREIVRFHPGHIARELIDIQENGGLRDGASFKATCYNGASGNQDAVRHFVAPGENGVLLVEGLTASEILMEELGHFRTEARSRALCVILDRERTAAQRQRLWRDTLVKGLPEGEARRRLKDQRRTLDHYQADNRQAWGNSRDPHPMGARDQREIRVFTGVVPQGPRTSGEPGLVPYRVNLHGPVSRGQFMNLLTDLMPRRREWLGAVIKVGNGDRPTARFVLTPPSMATLLPELAALTGPTTMKIYVPHADREVVVWNKGSMEDPTLVRRVA